MTRLTIPLTVLVAPLVATTSLSQDVAYWQAAHTWQTTSPATYYTHTIAFLLAAILIYRRRQHDPQNGVRPEGRRWNLRG